MDTYTGFAEVYDLFMDNVDYDLWADYLISVLQECGIKEGLVLELGCGTGELTERLAKAGYDMIGIDMSEEMLEKAQEKRIESGSGILYLNQDAREFELYGTVAAVVTGCDCINYILEEEELLEVFKLVNNYLDPKGLFFFDFNTRKKYENIGDAVIAENREEGSFIWSNYFDEEEEINEYELTLFLPEGDGLYRKCEELHYQRAYTLDTMKRLLEQAGMEYVGCYQAFSKNAPTCDTERVYVLARERGK